MNYRISEELNALYKAIGLAIEVLALFSQGLESAYQEFNL
jgi:hypothetical protein